MASKNSEPATFIADSTSAVTLFGPALAGLPHEELHVALLDAEMRLLKRTTIPGGGDSVELPLRALMTEALALDARCLVIAHNHPCGDPTPSQADKAVTRRLAEIAGALEIRLLDHLVFAGERCASFRDMGLL
jgi:DNA repair protein RadC